MKNNLGMSIRRTAAAAKVSYGTVYRIATSVLTFYAYKIKTLHQLEPPDCEKRIDGLEKIFFASDEAYFRLDCRVWSDSEPDFVLEQL